MLILFSCGGKHEEESDDVEWKEMDDFHMIMADVYHPLKDSNNLAPIKKQSGRAGDVGIYLGDRKASIKS